MKLPQANVTSSDRWLIDTGPGKGLVKETSHYLNQCSRGSLTPYDIRHYERDGVSNHQPHDCLLNRLLRRRSKKTSKLRITGLCAGNSPMTGEFPAQRIRNAENVSIWWRHHDVHVSHSIHTHMVGDPFRYHVSLFNNSNAPLFKIYAISIDSDNSVECRYYAVQRKTIN